MFERNLAHVTAVRQQFSPDGDVLARNTAMEALRCLAGDGPAAIAPGWETFRHGRSGSGRARRRPGTPPAQVRPVRPGPVGPQVGAGLTGTSTGRRRIIAAAATPPPSGGLAALPQSRR